VRSMSAEETAHQNQYLSAAVPFWRPAISGVDGVARGA